MNPKISLVTQVETFINRYVSLSDPSLALPLALWTIGTHLYQDFDAYPYLVITSHTKRSGKTRLSEIISFLSATARSFAAMTGPTLYRSIQSEHPTIIFDEAETLSSEAASIQRAVLNVGYRKGQTIPRTSTDGTIDYFDTYCPKVFCLIGDVYDTLRDRSILIPMKRGEPKERFLYTIAQAEGTEIRKAVAVAILEQKSTIVERYHAHKGLSFLTDRDEEIWMPLFILAQVFCPSRLHELSRLSVDMSTEKTAKSKKYVQLHKEEDGAVDDEYAQRLLMDLYGVFLAGAKVLSTRHVLEALKAVSVAPWRKFRGSGLEPHDLANMLSRFGVHPVVCRVNKDEKVVRGYRLKDVEKAVRELK